MSVSFVLYRLGKIEHTRPFSMECWHLIEEDRRNYAVLITSSKQNSNLPSLIYLFQARKRIGEVD